MSDSVQIDLQIIVLGCIYTWLKRINGVVINTTFDQKLQQLAF